MSEPHVTMTESYPALLLAAQALFTRFNDPRKWDKIDTEDRHEWLNITASVVGIWDANKRLMQSARTRDHNRFDPTCTQRSANDVVGAVICPVCHD